ncbi:hypothetical protein DH2020_016597 [Rehmannia glutinosa]|uniref:Kinesin motor domain-containing protein n=1 Tax=Rehmannia glutinosa TaxID=99300 RepID=A0ABR0WNG5_REHGL
MERIHVSVRPRPLSADDAKASPWRISGNSIFIHNQPSKFEFDQIFGEDCKTQDVYRARTGDIVAAAVRGFNGSSSEPGVIPLAVHDLFNIIQQDMDREFLLRMSYMEIYNEEINDLLAPEHRKLQIHESIERGIFVAGLREEIVASAIKSLNLWSMENIIESREKTDDAEAEFSCDAVRVSVLNLVDLAGSERAAKTGAEGVRLKEGSHINKSLMTLGTVIKKLSEGAESQGKLTRILQPALGGNANTAIICNITLAQIHADETKSSLQFASRALRVTNCAHVNEILTDAALLKRQKKEIEELRGKLQSELERERMALELEEEKRAQAEREKRLQEQAKKIENLSSMVFCANREETTGVYKKAKRRDTWCPGNLARKKLKETNLWHLLWVKFSTLCSLFNFSNGFHEILKLPYIPLRTTFVFLNIQFYDILIFNVHVYPLTFFLGALVVVCGQRAPSELKSTRADSAMGPLLPFEELFEEASTAELGKQDKDCETSALEDCILPDPHALLHESNDLAGIQAEYENLLLEFKLMLRTMSDIQIDYLTRKLAMADLVVDEKCRECNAHNVNSSSHADGNRSLRDSDAILVIKQLQEKIAILEMEKSSSQQQLDCVFDLATEQTISAQEKYEKLYEELTLAREEATVAHDTLASANSSTEESNWLISLLTEAEEIKLEFENSRQLIWSLSSVVDELRCFLSVMPNLIHDLQPSASQSLAQIESIVRSHKKVQSCLKNKVRELEDEKELNEKHEAEKSEFLCQLQMLQTEISSLSSCSLAKEKESIRKDLEKTKLKLKDTESKLKNAVQEKTKLEGEKSCAERELKRLQSQKAMLERDMSKRESIIGRRRDSTIDRSSNIFDHKRNKGSNSFADMEEYKKLEVLAFEMETTIASLEDQLAMANGEKDVATSRAESLASDLQSLSDELYCKLRVRTNLEESRFYAQEMESSLKILSEEKEDLSMQFTEALLTMEEEKAIWSSKEKASVEVIGEKEKLFTAENFSLSQKLSEVLSSATNLTLPAMLIFLPGILQERNWRFVEKNCKDHEELLTRLEENAALEKQCRCIKDKSSDVNPCTNEQRVSDDQSERSPESSNSQLDSKCQTCGEIEILQLELSVLRKERQYLLAQVQELEGDNLFRQMNPRAILLAIISLSLSVCKNMHLVILKDQVNSNKEKAKLRMRLRGSQTKLDAFRVRYRESVDELDYMNKKFEEASTKLKKQLASYGSEVLNLKKQLAALKGL